MEFFRDSDGICVVVKGHRRIIAMRELAKRNTPGFSANMPVEAIEVVNATPKDLLCRSVADNTNRNNFTVVERIRAAKTLYDGGVEVSRAAYALNYSTKQYLRDLRIANNEWMLAYVESDDIAPTQATELLEAAEKAGCLDVLKAYLDVRINERKKQIRQKASRDGKGKPAKEVKLKSELSTKLTDHWCELLSKKLPLDDNLAVEPTSRMARSTRCWRPSTTRLKWSPCRRANRPASRSGS